MYQAPIINNVVPAATKLRGIRPKDICFGVSSLFLFLFIYYMYSGSTTPNALQATQVTDVLNMMCRWKAWVPLVSRLFQADLTFVTDQWCSAPDRELEALRVLDPDTDNNANIPFSQPLEEEVEERQVRNTYRIQLLPAPFGFFPSCLNVRANDQVEIENQDVYGHRLLYLMDDMQSEFVLLPFEKHVFRIPKRASFQRFVIYSVAEPHRVFLNLRDPFCVPPPNFVRDPSPTIPHGDVDAIGTL